MAKVLFAYNGRVEVDVTGNCYGNELNDTLVNRYKSFGSSVSFLVRTKKITAQDKLGLTAFSSAGFAIIPVPEFASPIKYIKNILTIRHIVAEAVNNHDVVVARLPSLIGRLAVKKAIELKKPYLIEVVGCPWDALSNHSFLGKIYAPFAYNALRKQVYNAPFVLYVTNMFLQERYPTKGNNIGVTDVVLGDISQENLDKRIKKIEAQINSNCTLKIGTAAGYDVKFKGQEYVIKALHILKEKGISYNYIPVGKGTGERLKKLVRHLGLEGQVEFRGQIKHNQIFDYLDEIDIYIQPSKQEGLPRSVVEAMSRACPILGANTGGIPELIDREYIFEKGDVKQLVAILEQLNTQKMLEQAKNNFEKAKNYTKELTDQKRIEFYDFFKTTYSK